MSILKRHNIKPTPENIATVERIVRGVPRRGMPVSDETREAAQRLMRALDRDGWDGLMVFDLLPFKVDEDARGDRYGVDDPDTIPLPVVEALHAFYCEQTGTPDASMARHSVRDTTGKKQDAPALRFVTETLQTRNDKITVSAVEKAWRGRNSKGKKPV